MVGPTWSGYKGSYIYELSDYDVSNLSGIHDGKSIIDRGTVEYWLSTNAGDFQSIIDFSASLEVGDETINIPWADEDNELYFDDCQGEY